MNLLKRLFVRRESPSLGARGERAAEQFLVNHGYRILERNLNVGDDEADLIALDPDGHTVVVIEVKTRRDDHIAPEAHVHGIKQHRVSRLAARLIKQAKFRDHPVRFDVIAVVWPDDATGTPIVRHIPGAFQSRW
jgi:putative endonuclease